MKPIRILLISPYFTPHIGGSQRYMEELYAHIVRKHRSVQVDVLAYNTMGITKREKYRGMTIFRIPCWQILPGQFALPHPIHLIGALWNLAKRRPQIVHTHIRFFDACWWGWLYAKFIGARSVFTEHVASHPVHPNKWIARIAQLVDHTFAAWAIRQYDHITATNASAQSFLVDHLKIMRDITISYGGVDTTFFRPQKTLTRRLPGIPKVFSPGDIVVSFVGRMIWSKGVSHLYEAAKKLAKRRQNHVFVVFAGDGDLLELLRKKTKKDKLENRIYFTGPLTPKNVRQTLRSTDIFVHPSHHNEGFPNVILEAGACGCFIIATKNAGVSEMIQNRQTGLFIPPKNTTGITKSVIWAIKHKDQRKRISHIFRQSIKDRFEWKDIADSFYRDIVQAAHARPGYGLQSYLASYGT